MDYSYIDENYRAISDGLKESAAISNRELPSLLVSIKSAEIDEIEYLVRSYKVDAVGENRVNQLLSRYDRLKELGVDIHFIGSLQTNKVKYIIDKVSLIQSLDRIELAREIDKQAKKHGIVMDVLVEINSGREENKGGIYPEDAEAFCLELSSFSGIRLVGFMTMAPKCEKNSEYLKYFCETYQLVLDIWQKKLHNISIPIISMGMSESYQAATQAGATMVRIGRSMFNKNLNKMKVGKRK